MLHADDIEAMDEDSFEKGIAEELDSWDITSFNQSMPMGVLLDAGVNFDIRDEEHCVPDLASLGTKAVLALDPDLPGIAEFQNEEFGRGDELEPLTLEEHGYVLATYGDEEAALVGLLESVSNINATREDIETLIVRRRKGISAEELENCGAEGDVLLMMWGELSMAELFELRFRCMRNAKKVQGLHDRLRRSMQIDSIGNEWTYQSYNCIGHREGVVEDMATQADELPKSQQYQDDDLQDKLVAAEATNLVNFLYNTTGWTLETKGGIKVPPMGKMLGPDESNYFRRSKEKKEAFVEAMYRRISRSDLKQLKVLRQKVNLIYAKSVQHCVPQRFEGDEAIEQLRRRGMKSPVRSKHTRNFIGPLQQKPGQKSSYYSPNVTFQRGQRWHKLRLTKDQKAELLKAIIDRQAHLEDKSQPTEETKQFVKQMAQKDFYEPEQLLPDTVKRRRSAAGVENDIAQDLAAQEAFFNMKKGLNCNDEQMMERYEDSLAMGVRLRPASA